MTTREWLLTASVVIIVSVGLPLIKTMSVPAQAEPIYFHETLEYQTAKKLVYSNLRMNCKEFADLWKVLFPESECRKFRTNIGTNHWECNIVENVWADFNWSLNLKGRIYTK